MRHLDLFSGIGGFALAVRWLGHETVGFCEIDPWCRRVLDKHWPGVPKHDDIRTLEGTEYGAIDIITGGFPCQPFSVAGERRGEDDPRHLWPAMFRIIDTARPRFVLAENVPGIISMALDGVLADLETIGYTARAVVIPAGAVNALHRRDRVWIMAHRNGSDAGQQEPRGECSSTPVPGECCQGMADTGHTEPPGRDETQEGSRLEPGQPPCGEPTSCDRGAAVADPTLRGIRRGATQREAGQPALGSQGMGHTEIERMEGMRGSHDSDSAGVGGQALPIRADSDVGAGAGEQAARSLDAGPDGLPPRLVRSRWADGTWEHGIPRVVTEERERKQKLQAAGNAIVPVLAYEILRVMIGDNTQSYS